MKSWYKESSLRTDTGCASNELRCANGECAQGGVPCDSIFHCSDFSDEDPAQCCELGQYLNGTECTDCPIGTYQNSLGQDSCIPCLQGRYTENTASIDQTDCRGTLYSNL